MLLQPTPLILKDGRIANVSIHVVPFRPVSLRWRAAMRAPLRTLTAEVATDCFLTAQVIGHVGSAEVAGSDTLNAHRLARSRADAVQASLIEGGLPAKAIASVWDWQFMVREPRATLWVFRLTPGEDCEDAPLEGAAPALVAQAEAGDLVAADTAEPSERGAAIAGATLAPPGSTSPDPVIARPAGPSPSPVPTVTQALPAASPSSGAPAAADVRTQVGTVVALPGRPEPTVQPPAEAERAADQARGSRAGSGRAGRGRAGGSRAGAGRADRAKVDRGRAGRGRSPGRAGGRSGAAARSSRPECRRRSRSRSSSRPTAATSRPAPIERLRVLLRELGRDSAYEIVLQSSVSGSQRVVGAESTEDAMRYNRWLAERRLERVREWLGRNAAGRALTFREDSSRRATSRARSWSRCGRPADRPGLPAAGGCPLASARCGAMLAIMTLALGIDLGGTKIEIIALAASGAVLLRRRRPSPRGSYEATLAAIRALVREVEPSSAPRARSASARPARSRRRAGC